jgi:hypothetical protein
VRDVMKPRRVQVITLTIRYLVHDLPPAEFNEVIRTTYRSRILGA